MNDVNAVPAPGKLIGKAIYKQPVAAERIGG